ncbi:hypothetical protein BC832DRAFT_612912 [Gaertneriomyces semiglobifer]|nr:hypothetical protein BC832DRAFT_612912 [Gaertneriomyces semiglobifer]
MPFDVGCVHIEKDESTLLAIDDRLFIARQTSVSAHLRIHIFGAQRLSPSGVFATTAHVVLPLVLLCYRSAKIATVKHSGFKNGSATMDDRNLAKTNIQYLTGKAAGEYEMGRRHINKPGSERGEYGAGAGAADDAVTTDKLADGPVTSAKIADGTITPDQPAPNASWDDG